MTQPTRILITGSAGQLGRTLLDTWQESGRTGELVSLSRCELDIADQSVVFARLDEHRPEVIINAAAYTAVDAAESDAESAYQGNEVGPALLADWASRNGARLIHFSTDFVFDGESDEPYLPESKPNPLSVYGGSKLAGEQAVLGLGGAALILRVSWLYSPYGSNFVKTMLRLMRERDSLSVVNDQTGSPTAADSLAELVLSALDRPRLSGIYHWSDAGEVSWFEFALAIQDEALSLGLLKKEIPITPIPTSDYPTPARRPAYSVLNSERTRRDFGRDPDNWRAQLRKVLVKLKTMENDPR